MNLSFQIFSSHYLKFNRCRRKTNNNRNNNNVLTLDYYTHTRLSSNIKPSVVIKISNIQLYCELFRAKLFSKRFHVAKICYIFSFIFDVQNLLYPFSAFNK